MGLNHALRNGNATSSEIVALLSMGSRDMTDSEKEQYKKDNPKGKKTTIACWPGDAAMTYMSECNMERRLKRSISTDVFAKPLVWGKLVEGLVFDLMGTEYVLTSTDTEAHPIIPWWVGSKDGIKHDSGRTVMDIKSPYTLKSFIQLVGPLYNGLTGSDAMNAIRSGYTDKMGVVHKKHSDGEKFYWQLVSNACISNCKYAELVVYVPYKSELEAIKLKALNDNQNGNHFWLSMANDEELPYIEDGGYYNNINIIRFEVPEADKEYLTKRVLQAGKYLATETGNELDDLLNEEKSVILGSFYKQYLDLVAA